MTLPSQVHLVQLNGKRSITQKQNEYSVVPCTLEHVKFVADNIRQADKDELYSASGKFPLHALLHGFTHSDYLKAGCVNGQPINIFGTVPVLEGTALVWMVGTDGILDVSTRFLRESRKYADEMQENYPLLWNFVDAKNTVHHRWLQWLGFTLIRKIKYGVLQGDFYEFARIKTNV